MTKQEIIDYIESINFQGVDLTVRPTKLTKAIKLKALARFSVEADKVVSSERFIIIPCGTIDKQTLASLICKLIDQAIFSSITKRKQTNNRLRQEDLYGEEYEER